MKKKNLNIVLLITGILLLILSVILAIIETANINIIGGAGLPTFFFIFYGAKKGLYSTIAFISIITIISSIIISILNKRKNYEEK